MYDDQSIHIQFDIFFSSGRHKQEESLFEEMLQVSNAVVSAYFIVLVFRTNCCIWTVWICTTNIVY